MSQSIYQTQIHIIQARQVLKQPYGSYNTWSHTTTTDMVFGHSRTASAPSAAAARPAQPVPQPISTTCKVNFDKQNSWTIVEDQLRSTEINEDGMDSMEKLCRRVCSRLIFIARLAAQQPGLFNKASRQQQRAVIENPSDAQRSILMQRLHSQPAAPVSIGLTTLSTCCETQCCKKCLNKKSFDIFGAHWTFSE